MNRLFHLAVVVAVYSLAGHAAARDQIKIVGSSTVFPFSTAVAEQFGKATDFPTPVVESTGSGGGMKLFCSGVGGSYPDITNSSRRIKQREWELCQKNGVEEIVEFVVGFDGIVVASSKSSPQMELTLDQLFRALAHGDEEPESWSDVDAALPDTTIEVLGPPPSSGTRDAFEEMVMQQGCLMDGGDKEACKQIVIREDGAYIDAGENDNLIVEKLVANPDAIGVFGFSFLDQNADKIHGATVDGVEPTFENVSSGDYPVSRSLYVYVKKAHIGVIPGIQEFMSAFVSDEAIGEEGYTLDKGLISLSPEELAKYQTRAALMTPMAGL